MSDALPAAGAAARLDPALPFRRIALVLSGGGALGAYEIGVLHVLEALELVPTLVVGVSIGAVNAVAWLAAGRRTGPIEQVWRTARGETIGIQWVSLALRVAGALTVVVALLELVLTLVGARNPDSTLLDAWFWLMFAATGGAAAFFARRIARWLDQHAGAAGPETARKRLAYVTLLVAILYLIVLILGPRLWPYRFSATVVILLALAWVATTPGVLGQGLRRLALGLMPETGGRGLWSGRARRRMLERLVARGNRNNLTGPGTGLVISALAVDRGVVTHFVSWPDVDPGFERRIRDELGEVVRLEDAGDVISAAVASSAIPGVFQPERVAGRDFVDAGGFSNQPLHVAIASDVDAALVVLLSPSAPPDAGTPPADVVALGGRLLELANWRDLQTELRHLPAGWSRDGSPARVCVVEPSRPLPASVLQFDPERAGELIALGERDAWAALARAGWIELTGHRDTALEPGAPRG